MLSGIRGLLAAILVFLSVGISSQAQENPDAVTLIADQITVERDQVLIAEGSVEVEAQGRHLRASRIIYDREADRLSIEGPIILREGASTVILASAAELTPDLREGLISSVQIILDERLQIAASQGQRQQGRFTDLRQAVATSCEVCQPGRPPLWQIRAKRVIHDEVRQRIYFQNARFHILGVSVFYLPALSTPEPGVERARGFLVPSSSTSDLFGTGLKTPYFIPFGDHADITLTPYFASDFSNHFTRTIEGRYRQAFVNGNIRFSGAVSSDSILPDETRAYLFGSGNFDLPHRTKLKFNVEFVRDDTYLSDYDFSGKDRLENSLSLTRVVGDTRASGEIIVFNSLRRNEDNDAIPKLVGDAQFDKRWALNNKAGFVDATLLIHGHQRPSNLNILGRDSTHLRGQLRWSNEQTVGSGLRFGSDVRAIADVKQILQDDRFDEFQTSITPGVALTASYPMRRPGANGSAQLLEPMAQLVWTADYDIDAPNDDSTQPAFDAGNLFGFRRFPGVDRVEDGLRANVALRWQYIRPEGWSVGLTFGRVYRAEATDLFSSGTGLGGMRSDWLTQFDLDFRDNFTLRSLTLIDDQARATLNETQLIYSRIGFNMAAGYIWQENDPLLGQRQDLSEVTFDARYRITRSWAAEIDLRRDLIFERTTRAEFGVSYRNECIRVDFSGLRRFRNTVGAEPTITYGFTVSLNGFGTSGGPQRRVGRCAG